MSSSAICPGDGTPFHPQIHCCRTPKASRSIGHVSHSWRQDSTHPRLTWEHEELLMCQSTWLATASSERETVVACPVYWTASATSTGTYCYLLLHEKGSKARNLGCARPQKSSPQPRERWRGRCSSHTARKPQRAIPNNSSLLTPAWKCTELVYSGKSWANHNRYLCSPRKKPSDHAEGRNGSSTPQESWNRYLIAKNIDDEAQFHLLGESNHHLPLSVSCKVAEFPKVARQ